MSGLLSILPKPKQVVANVGKEEPSTGPNKEKVGEGDKSAVDAQLVAVTDDNARGIQSRYETIARMGHAPDRLVQTRLSDMQPKTPADEQLTRPSPSQVAEETEAARRALETIIMEKTAKTQPKNVTASVAKAAIGELIKYTPRETVATNGTPQTRVIKMVQTPIDPLEPPRFHHKRIPRPPPSPPAPRLHSPPRRVTAEEQRAWHIPPCISSWKNPKGYTVPLDKRLASDGRALQERTINTRMGDLAEALFLAEKHNREEVDLRRDVQRKLAEAEARQKDEQLRRMAEEAREEKRRLEEAIRREAERERREQQEGRGSYRDDRIRSGDRHRDRPTDDDSHGRQLSLKEREQLRRERDYEREREYRLSRMPAEQRTQILEREASRDISERVALGMTHGPSVGANGENDLFDERLFDRGGGLGTGFGAGDDETYTVYDRPLRDDKAIHMIYQPRIRGVEADEGEEQRPGLGDERDLKVARPDKAFAGASGAIGGSREGPVQFERHSQNRIIEPDHNSIDGDGSAKKEDPFGLDQFLSAAKKSRKGDNK